MAAARRLRFACLACLAIAAALARPGEAADRYALWLADGTRFTAPTLPIWPIPGVPCPLEDQDGLAATNHIRLLRDRQKSVEFRPPYLVMANGDVLAAAPVQLEPDAGRVGQVPRLRVQLEPPLVPVSGSSIAVRTDRVRRIVGAAASLLREPPPGTVVLADGRQLMARSIRWREYGLAILTADGVVEANYADLVDVVFPGIDAMAALLDDNLWAGGWIGAAILRFQSTGGSVLTAARVSREIEQLRSGRNRLTSTVYYYLQPAWADQPLALPESEIAWCGFRAADETPLSLLPAQTLANRRLLGQPEQWTANRDAAGQPLASGRHEADLGLSVHAHSAIAFDLPPAARKLVLSVGLDRAVGDGGCVRCKVVAEREDGKVLWDSGVFQGRDGVKRTGLIDVAEIARVVLVAEFAHDERPRGADPLDIRDQVVWLNPLVRLDLSTELPAPAAPGVSHAGRLASLLPGLADWELAGEGWKKVRVASRWNLHQNSWDPVAALTHEDELRLTRKLRVTHASDVLELLTGCPADLGEHDFSLKVNGQPVPWSNNDDRLELRQWVLRYNPARAGDAASRRTDHLAYWWDLSPWRGQEVTLELVLRGEREENEIAWRSLSLRSAASGLASGRPLKSDVPLTSLKPLRVEAEGRAQPEQDAIPRGRGEPIRFLGQRFTGGYGLTRNSAVTFAIEPQYRRFVALAGCCQRVAGPLQVLIDDRVVWEKPVATALEPAEQIALDIPAGAKTLTLKTGPEGYYGYAAFAEAGFVVELP